jgi:hypothetical protein
LNQIFEWSASLEYNFIDLTRHRFSPYVFAGIAAYYFDPYAYDSLGAKCTSTFEYRRRGTGSLSWSKPYNLFQFGIPFGGG